MVLIDLDDEEELELAEQQLSDSEEEPDLPAPKKMKRRKTTEKDISETIWKEFEKKETERGMLIYTYLPASLVKEVKEEKEELKATGLNFLF